MFNTGNTGNTSPGTDLEVVGRAAHAPGESRRSLLHSCHPHARWVPAAHGVHTRIHRGTREASPRRHRPAPQVGEKWRRRRVELVEAPAGGGRDVVERKAGKQALSAGTSFWSDSRKPVNKKLANVSSCCCEFRGLLLLLPGSWAPWKAAGSRHLLPMSRNLNMAGD